MISQLDIQIKAEQYLQFFQLNHQKNTTLLKQLSTKLNNSAKIIQFIWRVYITKKKHKMASKIQSYWRKYKNNKLIKLIKMQKFKQTFYKGKIAHFILKKLFPNNKYQTLSSQNNSNNHNHYQKQFIQTPIKAFYQHQSSKMKKHSINNKLSKKFVPYITITQTYKAEQKYIQKLRVYQKQNFSQKWQTYQKQLKQQLYKQASKKWVKKDNQIWINQVDKQINLQEYIQKNVQKIFKRQYQKYKQADIKLQLTSNSICENVRRFRQQYYQKMIQ